MDRNARRAVNRKKNLIIFYSLLTIFTFLLILFLENYHLYFEIFISILIGLRPLEILIKKPMNVKSLGLGKTISVMKKEIKKEFAYNLLKELIYLIVLLVFDLVIYGLSKGLIIIPLVIVSITILSTITMLIIEAGMIKTKNQI